ncbi:MAG TPA: deoxynucleoside kinase [Burkholderiaceae bacterium]|nr:deoxynucleoside kinase [Burkholderiaceae bacterium]
MKRLRHIAIEGPIGAGKSTLASLLAPPLGAELLLERPHDNPFLKDFYVDGPRYAFQTQLFFLFQRIELTRSLAQPGMFAPLVVSDFTLEKDRLFARLTLSDEEYRLYSMIHDRMAPKLPQPDLVIWLDGSMVVLRDRIRRRGRPIERRIESDYLRAVADAYGALFDERTDLPLLVVDVDRFDPLRKPTDLQYLIERISAFQGPRESLLAPPTIGAG